MTYLSINQSEYPIITFHISDSIPEMDEFKAYLDQLDQLNLGVNKVSILFNASQAQLLSAEHRIAHAAWLKRRTNIIKSAVSEIAMVIPSYSHEIMLTALFALQNSPVPIRTFSNHDDALNYLYQGRASNYKTANW